MAFRGRHILLEERPMLRCALLGCGVVILGMASSAKAAVFEVGPGRTYTTIQAAVNAAAALDSPSATHNTGQADPVQIIIDGGTYAETITIPADAAVAFNGANDGWTIKNRANERVLLQGKITVMNDRDHLTFDGINIRATLSRAMELNQTVRNLTIRNAFIIGAVNPSADLNTSGIWANRAFGGNALDHVTIVDNQGAGVFARDNSHFNITNSIIAFNPQIGYKHTNNTNTANISTSLFFGNSPNFDDPNNRIAFGSGNVFSDPMFVSLDPNHPHFLWLAEGSPASGTATTANSSGEFNMGAMPTLVPEPASLSLLALGVLLVTGRRRWS